MSRLIDADALIAKLEDDAKHMEDNLAIMFTYAAINDIKHEPTVDATEVVRCKNCKHWRRQTNYAGAQLSFGFCESDDMWRSLYGETYEVAHIDTDDDFYCGYAERRQDG